MFIFATVLVGRNGRPASSSSSAWMHSHIPIYIYIWPHPHQPRPLSKAPSIHPPYVHRDLGWKSRGLGSCN